MPICITLKIFSFPRREEELVIVGPQDLRRDKNFNKILWR
jgi:hypothetical protein